MLSQTSAIFDIPPSGAEVSYVPESEKHAIVGPFDSRNTAEAITVITAKKARHLLSLLSPSSSLDQ